MTLKRLKYISRFSRAMSAPEIDALVAHAREKNARLDVTGMLVTTGQIFYQVLEGPPAQVDALYAAISRDPRHTDVLLLEAEEDAARRVFPDWAMRKVDLGAATEERLDPLREILATIIELRVRADRLAWTLERAVLWEMLGD